MKIDKEQILIFSSVGFLLVITFLSMIYMRVAYQGYDTNASVEMTYQGNGDDAIAEETPEQSDQKQKMSNQNALIIWSGYLCFGQFEEGNVLQANEAHADCFVMVEMGKSQGDAPDDDRAEDSYVKIAYSDDFVLPEYSSLNLAKDIKAYLEKQNPATGFAIYESDSEVLINAMEPAVFIETNSFSNDFQKQLIDCLTDLFAED